MCPRIAWAKVRPGDLIQLGKNVDDGTQLYYDDEAGANPDDRAATTTVMPGELCICLAYNVDTLLVLPPNGRFGWSHRIWWEKAGVAEQEWEVTDADGRPEAG